MNSVGPLLSSHSTSGVGIPSEQVATTNTSEKDGAIGVGLPNTEKSEQEDRYIFL